MVKFAEKWDCPSIARLHVAGITAGFLPQLGRDFLVQLYSAMLESEYGTLLVSVDQDGWVDGFVSASNSTKRFYLDFLTSPYCLQSVAGLYSSLWRGKKSNESCSGWTRGSLLVKCKESLFYPFRMKDNCLPEAELLSIVVRKGKWGSGIGARLLEGLKEQFFLQGVREFKVVVGTGNKRACQFYEKNGGRLVNKIQVHKGEMSNVYVFDT